MDNMPDFDSMTPEEMMAWMEALAKRQGATEGMTTSGDMEVPEIDPDTVGDIDEPGYIPFGMDPEVWAQKKAKEDAERSERIAVMKADKADKAEREKTGPQPVVPAAEAQPSAVNPLDFLANMSGVSDSPDTSPYTPIEIEPQPADETPLEDIFADLSGAVVADNANDMDWLSSLGGNNDLPSFDNLDFGSLEALDQPAAQGEGNQLEWLESLVSSGDSEPVEAVAEQEELPYAEVSAAAPDMDDMLLDDADILEDSAVSAVLNDPMEWLADFADTEPMDEQAAQSHEVLAMSDDLDSFFDRIQSNQEEELPTLDLNAPMGGVVESGMFDFGGTPDLSGSSDLGGEMEIASALTQGAEVPAEDVKAWMDSLLDRGIQRTDVTDEDDDEEIAVTAEPPSWLTEQIGDMAPSTQEMLAAGDDLPDWLTAPVTDAQTLEFEEMFAQMSAQQDAAPVQPALPEIENETFAPLDTGAIRIQMNDPWVEAFELERDERLSDTGKLAAWYESAAHEVQAARQSDSFPAAPQEPAAVSMSSLKAAQLPGEEELPPGEPQAIPTWLGGVAAAPPMVAVKRDEVIEPVASSDEELPDWLRAAQLESDDVAGVPSWLTDSLSTEEFEILQMGSDAQQAAATTALQDEPTTPLDVVPQSQLQPVLTQQPSITQRPTSELPKVTVQPVSTTHRQPRESIPAHEAGNIIMQARANQKMGDTGAMLESYERLIRSEVALEDVESDMEKVSKDAVNKTNPAVLRVYGDVLLRRGKLQQALDTYRAALNLL